MHQDKSKGHFSHTESCLSSCLFCVGRSILGGVRVEKQPGCVRGEWRGTPQLFRVCPASAATAMPPKKDKCNQSVYPRTHSCLHLFFFFAALISISICLISLHTNALTNYSGALLQAGAVTKLLSSQIM